MKARIDKVPLTAIAIAVASAIVSMSAHADGDEAAALKTPANFVEGGATNTSSASQKFGEYNGLQKKGTTGVLNFGIRGGDAYGDGNGTIRWSLTGRNIGLSNQEASVTYSDQGRWNIGIAYDELRHNVANDYQTPYLGEMGGNRFLLAPGFGTVANTQTLSATQQAAFRSMDVGTTRKNTSLNAGLRIDAQWGLSLDVNHLDQAGAKLLAFGSMGANGAQGEKTSILPNPTNWSTDTVNAAIHWTGNKAHLTAGYFGSFFRQHNDQVTFQTWGGANTLQNMGTAPSNQFHQLNLSGGYAFSQRTRLTGSLSYGRSTQNQAFMVDAPLMRTPAPVGSLDGLVVNTHADLKLADRTIKDLSLSAALRYDERDNRTPSNIYNYTSIAVSAAHDINAPNAPLSYRKAIVELAADYRMTKSQKLRVDLTHEDVSRWCNQYAVNAAYPAGTNCVVATGHREDRLGATYKVKAGDALDLSVGYSYADRRTRSDPNAILNFVSVNGGGVKGLNAGDFLGFYPYFDASRTQQLLKPRASWQVNERFSLDFSGKVSADEYDSTYGVRKGSTWSANIDPTYAYSENGSLTAFVTRQHRQRDMTNLRNGAAATNASATAINIPPFSTWSNALRDDDTTVGAGFRHGGLLGGKVALSGDYAYSVGTSAYNTTLNWAGATTTGATCDSALLLSCGAIPDIRYSMTSLRLNADYQIDKKSQIGLRYLHQRLTGSDYYFNGLQYGFTPTGVLPTNQQPGAYSVHVVALTYIYNF